MNFIKKNQIRARELIDSTKNGLIELYSQSKEMFSYATSYGQILLVTENLFQLNLFYMQDGITEGNIYTATRAHSIYGQSVLAGHHPYRGKGAIGEISLRLKPSSKELVGDYIFIPNYLKIKCENNGLNYILDLGRDDISISISNFSGMRMRIVQGEISYQQFRGTGKNIQTYYVATDASEVVDHDFVRVTVDGKKFNNHISLFDTYYKEPACLINTGIDKGIIVAFGNDLNLTIPSNGQQIRIDYLVINGREGNMLDVTATKFKFSETGFDINGNEVKLDDFFDIVVEQQPSYGTDPEAPELTKLIAPMVSVNFLIHDDKSLKYFIERLNYFQTVKPFKNLTTDQNRYDLMLLPRVKDQLSPGEDYFSVDMGRFIVSETQTNRLINMIEESGRKSSNIVIVPKIPKIRRSVLVLVIEAFKIKDGVPVNINELKRNIREMLSSYGLSNKRVNKIPHSDLVRKLDEIKFVDTVKAIFIPEFDGDIDSKGNFKVSEDQIALIRGGFSKNNKEYIDEYDPEGSTMGSVNINIELIEE